MVFCQYYSQVDTNCLIPIHHAYYFQTQLSTPDEKLLQHQTRRKPLSSSMTGPDLKTVSSNVTCIHPVHSATVYITLNLHFSFHSSANVSDINLWSKFFKRVHINDVTLSLKHSCVSRESCSKNIHQDMRGKISDENITTVDLDEELPQGMTEAMARKDGYVFKIQVVDGRKKESGGECLWK